ncbi:MAG: hypothetical protein ACLR93_03200 [Alistipes onderdonkii]
MAACRRQRRVCLRGCDPAKWSAETPNLYTLEIAVDGGVTETVTQPRLPFRGIRTAVARERQPVLTRAPTATR